MEIGEKIEEEKNDCDGSLANVRILCKNNCDLIVTEYCFNDIANLNLILNQIKGFSILETNYFTLLS